MPLLQRPTPGVPAGLSDLDDLGATVITLSVDNKATAAEMAEKHKVAFKVGHSAYSAGALGRLTEEDVVGMLRYIKKQAD